MEFKYKNIGISGVAGCGKNTLSDIIIKLLQRLELPYRELSIANNLKQEVSWVSRELYGINSSNCTREEKNTIRPLLVAHGVIKRELSPNSLLLIILFYNCIYESCLQKTIIIEENFFIFFVINKDFC